MVESTQDNSKLYEDINAAVEKQKAGEQIPDEQKSALIQQLKELADRSNDYDPENLDNIIAFASGISSPEAETVLSRASEQKQKAEAQPAPSQENDQQKSENTTVDAAEFNKKIPLISQPSYDVYKTHEALMQKDNLTADEQQTLQSIEQQTETILSNIDLQEINADNAVTLKDYLDISNASGKLDEAAKQRNEQIGAAIAPKLEEFDKANEIESLAQTDYQTIQENTAKWTQAAGKAGTEPMEEPLAEIFKECPEEIKQVTSQILVQGTIHQLKKQTPGNTEEEAVGEYSKTLKDKSEEYAALVKTEYLKQQAMEDFCQKNKLSEEDLNKVLTNAEAGLALSEKDKQLKQQFEAHMTQHIARFPDFKGPYNNQKQLATAMTLANAVVINRASNLESRMARLVKAPSVSKEISQINNNFAEKHPKIYGALRWVSSAGKAALKNGAISAGIGFAFGPAGLAAYSALKTGKAIHQSYKRYKEQNGGGFGSFLKHLTKRENRAELFTLAGQVAATAVSVGFSIGGGLDLGMVGKLAGHTNGHVAQAVAEQVGNAQSGFLTKGFNKIMSSSRRATTMAVSLAAGVGRGFSALSNQRHARKELEKLMKANGVEASKESLRALEKIDNPQAFAAALKELAPNMPQEAVQEAFGHAKMARESHPKTAFAFTTLGAVAGLAAAGAAEEMHDFKLSSLLHNEENSNAGSSADASWDTNKSLVEHLEENSAKNSEWMKTDWLHNNDQNAAGGLDEMASPVEAAHETAENLWNNDNAADRRLESFGIDAKNANEMLRDMGIIKEDDHHFYRQSELAKLVNETPLSDEQKTSIQEWANDRDARVHNLKTWQAEHPAPQNNGSGFKIETPKNGFHIEIPTIQEELPQPTIPEMEIKETHLYSIEGKHNGVKIAEGAYNVSASNAKEAAQQFYEDNGDVKKSSKLTITDEEGDKTTIRQRIGKMKDTITVKEEEDGKRVALTKAKFYKDGDGNENVVETYEKRDVDGDGKRDRVYTTTGKNGEVRLTEFANGETRLEHTQADGQTTTLNKSEIIAKRGDDAQLTEARLQDSYSTLSRMYKGKGR